MHAFQIMCLYIVLCKCTLRLSAFKGCIVGNGWGLDVRGFTEKVICAAARLDPMFRQWHQFHKNVETFAQTEGFFF